MGVIEDIEPPLKRMKGPLGESKSFSGNSSDLQAVSHSLGELMARPLNSQGDGDTIGSKGVIKKSEFIKIITRTLYSLGYKKSGALLEEESGTPLYSSAVKLFMEQVMAGKWDESVATLHMIGLQDEAIVKSASFVLLEQKFVELLKADKVRAALDTLRNELVPLHINIDRVHELASCVISPLRAIKFANNQDGQDNSRSKIMERLQKLLPASIMIPEKRLEHLIEKALDVQINACVFHNTLDSDLSLYCDHQCGKNQIPSRTLQVRHSG